MSRSHTVERGQLPPPASAAAAGDRPPIDPRARGAKTRKIWAKKKPNHPRGGFEQVLFLPPHPNNKRRTAFGTAAATTHRPHALARQGDRTDRREAAAQTLAKNRSSALL